MKRFKPTNLSLLLLGILCNFYVGIAQVGINTTNPNGILHVESSNMGVVLPRVALTSTIVELPVTNPNGSNIVIGTTVYNTATTNTGTNDVTPGIYSWNGTSWTEQFQKRQYSLFQSNIGLRSRPGSTLPVSLNGATSPTFTAEYTGTYKLRIRVDFGGGDAKPPNESGTPPSEGDLNIARASGKYTFNFNGTNFIIPVNAYSTAYNAVTPSTNYFAIWQEFFINEYVTLNANQTVSMTMTFLQDAAPEFATTTGGYGYVAYDIPCSVEVIYMGE